MSESARIIERRFNVENVTITKGELRRICEYVFLKRDEAIKLFDYAGVEVAVYSEGGLTTKCSELSVFNEGDVLDTSRTGRFELSFSCFRRGAEGAARRSIDFGVWNGDMKGSVSVKGEDREWVNAVYVSLKEICDSFKKQNTIYGKNRFLINGMMSIIFGGSFIYIVYKIMNKLNLILYSGVYEDGYIFTNGAGEEIRINGFLVSGIVAASVFIIGDSVSGVISRHFDNASKCVHLDMGPDDLNYEKKSKDRIKYVLFSLMLPFLFGLLANLT